MVKSRHNQRQFRHDDNDKVEYVRGRDMTETESAPLLRGRVDSDYGISIIPPLGRHLGLWSTTFLVVGRIVGSGIFSTPSAILSGLGSVGLTLVVWTIGLLLCFCGLIVWLEFAKLFPVNGGEKVYLEKAYPRPALLATVVYASWSILLGFTASGSIVFASNLLVALAVEPARWNTRCIAIALMIVITLVHGVYPTSGVQAINFLAIVKVGILLFIVGSGIAVLFGLTSIKNSPEHFSHPFAGSTTNPNQIATALFKVFVSFAGWSNAAYVLSEVKDPVRTIRIAGPVGLGLCGILYLLANIAYFAAVPAEEIKSRGVTVAALFIQKVYGDAAQRVVSLFICLSAAGNVLAVTFTHARVIQELAKEGILPMSRFWAGTYNGSPLPALLLHFIPTAVVILGPPPGDVYSFILNTEGYVGQIMLLFVGIGLLKLQTRLGFVSRIATYAFISSAVLLVIVPLLPPDTSDTSLPYWLSPVIGISVLCLGVLAWTIWQRLLPWYGRYQWTTRKEYLDDGTPVIMYHRDRDATL